MGIYRWRSGVGGERVGIDRRSELEGGKSGDRVEEWGGRGSRDRQEWGGRGREWG